MLDTRRYLRNIIDSTHFIKPSQAFVNFFISLFIAVFIAFIPEYDLSKQGVYALFILVFAAGLWITEAIPAFSVALLIIALQILLLGFEGFNFKEGGDWTIYLNQWSNPLVFLFLAGFIMAIAASKTKLDIWIAKKVLFFVGGKPHNIISGLIAITFVLSMFVSNTATAAMMMTVISPILMTIKEDNPFSKAALLAVVIGANLGGMCTIIGTPPNAIAVGFLGEDAPSFIGWMVLASPAAIITAIALRQLILKLYPSSQGYISLKRLNELEDDTTKKPATKNSVAVADWKKKVVLITFSVTIGLWLSEPLHHIPTTVVAFLPIVVFTLFNIIGPDDMKEVRWDVIILIIGGLSLGFSVTQTGVDSQIASMMPTQGISIILIMAIFSYMVVVVSNFMSNTAATNIILPIAVAIGATYSAADGYMTAIVVALSASFAMMLPVSTPPNAIVYSSKALASKNFLILGAAAAIVGPLAVFGWLYIVFSFGFLI